MAPRQCVAILLAPMLLLCAVVPHGAQSPDEAAIRALLDRYFAALATEDLEAATQVWSDKSPDLAATKTRLKELFSSNDQFDIRNLRVRRLEIDGARASALVTVDSQMINTITRRPPVGTGKQSQNLSFVKEAEGWRIWRTSSAEEELAERVIEAKGDRDRELLLTADRELVTGFLGRSLLRIGERFRMQLDFDQAMNAYQLAKDVDERVGDRYGVAACLNVIGVVQVLMGEHDAALESMNRSVQLREEMGLRDLLSIPVGSMSHVYREQGNYGKALETGYKALAIAEEAGDRQQVAELLVDIGTTHRMQYNLDLALEYLKKGLAESEETGQTVWIAHALESMSLTYSLAGDYNAAVDAWHRAYKAMGNPTTGIGAATMFMSIGNTHMAYGKHSLALEYYLKALPLIEQSGIKYTYAILQSSIGQDYYFLRNHQKGIEYLERTSLLARQSHLLEPLSRSLSYLGLAYRAVGRTDDARRALDEAIAANETMRAQVAGGEQERERFFEKMTLPYYAMVEILAGQNKHEEALTYAERAKGRVLLDVIRSGRAGVTKTMSVDERERERKLSIAIASLNTRIQGESSRPRPNQTRISELGASLEQARLDQRAFQSQLYTAHPDLRVRRGEAQTITLEQAGELLTDSRTALLEYAVAGERTFLFAVTASPGKLRDRPVVKLYDLNIKRNDLAERVQKLNQRIANNDIEFEAQARDLYDLLVAPARQQLQGKTRLVIVPDDVLWETPFQALRSGDGRFLIQSAAISYAPSLTVLREIVNASNHRSRSTTLLAMGNPKLAGQTIARSKNVLMSASFEPLPEAERLVNGLGQMYGRKARVYVGAEAREETLKSESSNYSILQLATHGVINNASPMYSHIVLAQSKAGKDDGLLEAWEIMQLDLKADLAILSACETARGRLGAGEGVIGLAWALFVAGCPTTVVSQWKVESSSTTELMLAFHRSLQMGASKSEAMRQAALKLMSEKRFTHPFYWAGFIVVGDGN